jgi:hypothetical protein
MFAHKVKWMCVLLINLWGEGKNYINRSFIRVTGEGRISESKQCIQIYGKNYLLQQDFFRYTYSYIIRLRGIRPTKLYFNSFHLNMVVRPKHGADNLNKIIQICWNIVAFDGNPSTWSNTCNKMQTPKFKLYYIEILFYWKFIIQGK